MTTPHFSRSDRRLERVRGFIPPTASCNWQKRAVPVVRWAIKRGVHLLPRTRALMATSSRDVEGLSDIVLDACSRKLLYFLY